MQKNNFFKLFFCSIIFLLSISNVYSQELVEKTTATTPFGLLNLVLQGGILIYPLLFLSFVAVVLILFYFLTIRKGCVVTNKFMRIAEYHIRKGDYLTLIAMCNKKNQAVAQITHKALDFAVKNPGATLVEIKEVTESEGSHQASLFSGRISYLADIGTIAPMIGLLGTVVGMIKAFNELSQTVGVLQTKLSGGVAEALITTASGLVIGIVAMIFYSIFRGRVQSLISEMESSSTHLLALISAQYRSEEENYYAQNNNEKINEKLDDLI